MNQESMVFPKAFAGIFTALAITSNVQAACLQGQKFYDYGQQVTVINNVTAVEDGEQSEGAVCFPDQIKGLDLEEGYYLESRWNDRESNAQVLPIPVYVYDPNTEVIWAGHGYNDRESNTVVAFANHGDPAPSFTKGNEIIVVADTRTSGWMHGSHLRFRNLPAPTPLPAPESNLGGFNDRD